MVHRLLGPVADDKMTCVVFAGFARTEHFSKVKAFLAAAGVNLAKIRHLFFTRLSGTECYLGVITYASYAAELKDIMANLHQSQDNRFKGISLKGHDMDELLGQETANIDKQRIDLLTSKLELEAQALFVAKEHKPMLSRTYKFLMKTYHDCVRCIDSLSGNASTANTDTTNLSTDTNTTDTHPPQPTEPSKTDVHNPDLTDATVTNTTSI